MMKYLAIDFGAKRTGLAACDELGMTTRLLPVLRLEARGKLVEEIVKLVASESFRRLILGLPLNVDGSAGPAALKAQELAQALRLALEKKQIDCELVLWNEGLTTFAAEQQLRERKVAKKKAKDYLDSMAAQVLLEDYLAAEARRRSGVFEV